MVPPKPCLRHAAMPLATVARRAVIWGRRALRCRSRPASALRRRVSRPSCWSRAQRASNDDPDYPQASCRRSWRATETGYGRFACRASGLADLFLPPAAAWRHRRQKDSGSDGTEAVTPVTPPSESSQRLLPCFPQRRPGPPCASGVSGRAAAGPTATAPAQPAPTLPAQRFPRRRVSAASTPQA